MSGVTKIMAMAFLICIGMQTVLARICSVKELSVGRWAPYNATKKRYMCCPQVWDNFKHVKWPQIEEMEQQCGSRDYSNLLFYDRRDDTRYNAPFAPMRCSCEFQWNTWTTPNPLEKWRWEPSGCEMMPFSAVQFCQYLGNQTILFVGDSLTVDFFVIVNNLIIRDQPPGPCAKQLHYLTMFKADDAFLPLLRKAVLEDIRPDIIIINMAAHYLNLELYLSGTAALWKDLTDIRQQSNKPIEIIWKSNVLPHEQCSAVGFPPTTPLTPEEEIRPSQNAPHGWFNFPTMDRIAHSLASAYNYTFWDIQALRLRPDAHPSRVTKTAWPFIDCLHLCSPGPQDVLANYLHHYLYWHRQLK